MREREKTLNQYQSYRPFLSKKLKSIAVSGLALSLLLSLPGTALSQETDTQGSALDTVVVTATRAEETLREVTSNITIINEEQIEASTANNMADLLKSQGFYYFESNGLSQVQIRGIHTGQTASPLEARVLILINGRRTGITSIQSVGINNIERVEIIRGPSAVQYGPSGMGGVINIITKKGIDQEFSASVELGMGSFDLFKESLYFNGSKNGFDFSAGVTNWSRDDYDVSGGDRYYNTGVNNSTDANIAVGFTFAEKHRIGVDYNYFNKDADGVNSLSGYQKLSAPELRPYSVYEYENDSMAFTYDGGTLNDMFTWSATYAFGSDSVINKAHKNPNPNAYAYNKSIDTDTFNASITYNGDIASLTAGIDYLKYDLTDRAVQLPSVWSPAVAGTAATYENTAAYFAGKLRLLDNKFIISAGGRFDEFEYDASTIPNLVGIDSINNKNSSKQNHFSPSVGLAYLPTDWLKFRANYSEGFKMPAPGQIMGNATTLPAPDLDPETTKTFEFGVDLISDSFTAGLTYFTTDYTNKIIGGIAIVPTPAQDPKFRLANLEKAVLSGFELSFRGDIGTAQGWDFIFNPYVNATYMTELINKDPRERAGGTDRYPNAPKIMVSYGTDFNLPDYDLKVNVNAVYSGKIWTQDWTDGGKWFEAVPGTVVDMSMEKGLYDFTDKSKVSLKVEASNIFDEDNEYYNDYPGLGRNFYVGVKFDYN